MTTGKLRLLGLSAAMAMTSVGAQAALQARDLDGNLATAEAYYDVDLNISWLTTANPAGGVKSRADALSWVAAFEVGGVSGWRLPSAPSYDATCSDSYTGAYGTGCTGSEMGHLFYVEGISTVNPGFFIGLQTGDYWTSSSLGPNPLTFNFSNGYQGIYNFIHYIPPNQS